MSYLLIDGPPGDSLKEMGLLYFWGEFKGLYGVETKSGF